MKRLTCLLFASPVLAFSVFAEAVPNFRWQTIDPAIGIGYGLAIADFNGDKKPDIFLADAKEIVCYVAPDWKRQVIANKLSLKDNVCVAAADLDGDGLAEVAAGATWNPGNTTDPAQSGSTHLLRPGSNRSEPWTSLPLPHEVTVHRMRWVQCSASQQALVVLPLHGQGNINGAGPNGVRILAHLQPSATKPDDWKTVEIDKTHHITHNFDQRRLGDHDELLVGSKEGPFLATPAANGQTWEIRSLPSKPAEADEPASPGIGEIRYWNAHATNAQTFDFACIEPFHGNLLVAYKQSPDQKSWTREVIDSDTLNQGHALACGDLLGLGSQQIVVGWREPNAEKKVGIRLFWQKTKSSPWISGWLADNTVACEDLKLADLDGDGDLDIIAAGRATKNVVIGWNQRVP